ncbi:hypothetical protein ACFXGT_08130 [Streptomyces sp. NPDC059352]|uniref:hypothetical protein n=1 Tax=Streptomyces sp. NPDC059352 TaxID=3346810 RepID=UPI0036B866E7
MSGYNHMANADVLGADELYEMDRADEYRLDAEDEVRWAAEDAAAATQPDDDEPWLGLADGEER